MSDAQGRDWEADGPPSGPFAVSPPSEPLDRFPVEAGTLSLDRLDDRTVLDTRGFCAESEITADGT
jgi:hypothetical protein